MRTFLTGIDGFVGRHLAARLAEDGHEVHGVTLEAGATVSGAVSTSAADVRDAAAVSAAIDAARPQAVVHLAGQTSNAFALDHPAETFAVNVMGTLHVLEACRAAAVERVLLVTTGEVYGDRPRESGPASEEAPLAPITPYGASKAAQDLLGYQYGRSHGLPIVRARAYPHTGPGQSPRFVFASVARRIALAEAGRGSGDIELGWIEVGRDVSDVRDVVEGYVRLLESGEPGEAYNVCRGEARTLRDWLGAMVDMARVPVRLAPRAERFRIADIEWLAGDPAKIERATGWRAVTPWEETARDLLEEWRSIVAEGTAVAAGGASEGA